MMRARTQPARQRLPVGKNVDAAESVRIALLVVFRRTFLATRRDYIGRSVGVNAIVIIVQLLRGSTAGRLAAGIAPREGAFCDRNRRGGSSTVMSMETPTPLGNVADTERDPDRLLVQAAARGESDALVELMRRNAPWVRGVVFAACGDADMVEDVQQQVWLSAWRRAGSLSDPAKWRSWLYALARHAGIDAARRARRRRKLRRRLEAWLPPRGAGEPDAARRLILKEHHQRALKAIAALPEIYRGPFVLRHLADWSYRRIAEAMDLPVDTVETRLVRARRILRETLTTGAD